MGTLAFEETAIHAPIAQNENCCCVRANLARKNKFGLYTLTDLDFLVAGWEFLHASR
jgi:hypothetical protein